jgi:hypothetical protein
MSIRENEILLLIKNKGFERGTTEALIRLAEFQNDVRRQFKEMAEAFEALARVQTMLNGVADGLQARLEKLDKRDDDPDSTRGMLK